MAGVTVRRQRQSSRHAPTALAAFPILHILSDLTSPPLLLTVRAGQFSYTYKEGRTSGRTPARADHVSSPVLDMRATEG
jgi:hypothetical protein